VEPERQHCLTSKAMRSERYRGSALLFSSLAAVWHTCRGRLRCLPTAVAGLVAARCCVPNALQQQVMPLSSVIATPCDAGFVNPVTSSPSSDVDVQPQQHSNVRCIHRGPRSTEVTPPYIISAMELFEHPHVSGSQCNWPDASLGSSHVPVAAGLQFYQLHCDQQAETNSCCVVVAVAAQAMAV
jgi:hypothetical protein